MPLSRVVIGHHKENKSELNAYSTNGDNKLVTCRSLSSLLLFQGCVKEEWFEEEISSLTCLAAELRVLLFFPVEEGEKTAQKNNSV